MLGSCRGDNERKRDREFSPLPDGKGLGDYVQMLQIYEAWELANYSAEWCKRHGVQVGHIRGQVNSLSFLCFTAVLC